MRHARARRVRTTSRVVDDQVDGFLQRSPRLVAVVRMEMSRAEGFERPRTFDAITGERDGGPGETFGLLQRELAPGLVRRQQGEPEPVLPQALNLIRIGMHFGRDRLVRVLVVMREQLGELALPIPGLSLDPFRYSGMRPCPIAPGQALVGDVLDQDVPERELTFADDRGAGARMDETPVLETPQDLVELDRIQTGLEEGPDGAVPERSADDGGRLQDPLLDRRQQIDPRREDTLNGVGDLEVLGARRLVQQPLHDLFQEERVSAGALQDLGAEIVRERTALHEQIEELR